MTTYTPISINIPIEIDAGSFATAVTVQGETVSYNHVNVPLIYGTQTNEPTSVLLGNTFIWKEDSSDQTQIIVDVNPNPVDTYENGTALVKDLFKKALSSETLRSLALDSGIVYPDGTPRDTVSDPLKFYKSNTVHGDGSQEGSTLKSYVLEYLHENLSAIIGLAATTGTIDLTFSRNEVDATEIIAQALTNQICGSANTEQGVAAAALRQNIYEQMFTLDPARFMDSSLMNQGSAADSSYKTMPFIKDDTISFLVTFKFPANQITTPVIQNAIRSGSNTFVSTGSKITVMSPTDATTLTRPNLSDFPSCTVLLRTKITNAVTFTNSLPYTVNYLVNMGRADPDGGWKQINFSKSVILSEVVCPYDGSDNDGDSLIGEQTADYFNGVTDLTNKFVLAQSTASSRWRKIARAQALNASGIIIYGQNGYNFTPNTVGPTAGTSIVFAGKTFVFPNDINTPAVIISNEIGQYLVNIIRSNGPETVYAVINGKNGFADNATFTLGPRLTQYVSPPPPQ